MRQDLPENELTIFSTTKECTTVEDPLLETNPKAAVRGLVLILPSLWLTSASRNCQKTNRQRRTELWRHIPRWRWERINFHPPISLTQIWIQESSEKPREVIPTTAEYIMATGKQTLVVLQSAAAFIPVPLIREAVGIALKIIEVCEKRYEVCTIPPRKGCKMVYNILFPEYIRRRWKAQRVEG